MEFLGRYIFMEYLPAGQPVEVDKESFLLEGYIPTEGIVLLHGPGGVGKTAFALHLAQCVATGEPFLGLTTAACPVLYVNADMPGNPFKLRLLSIPGRAFDVVNRPDKIDLLRPETRYNSGDYELMEKLADQNGYGLIIMDSLKRFFRGDSNNNEIPDAVYRATSEWLPKAVTVYLYHDRKVQRDSTGAAMNASADDASGSRFWVDCAASALHLSDGGKPLVWFDHSKTQVSAEQPRRKLYVDMEATRVELWEDAHRHTLANAINELHEAPNYLSMSLTQKKQYVADVVGKSVSTVTRWLQIYGVEMGE